MQADPTLEVVSLQQVMLNINDMVWVISYMLRALFQGVHLHVQNELMLSDSRT
jgi:hypothetical protein